MDHDSSPPSGDSPQHILSASQEVPLRDMAVPSAASPFLCAVPARNRQSTFVGCASINEINIATFPAFVKLSYAKAENAAI